jgi:cytochrome c553
MFGKTLIWFVVTAAIAVVSFSAVQGLPEGEGKKLVEERCSVCHGTELITGQRMTQDAWKEMVAKMVGYGTQLDQKEITITVDYLTKNFGKAAQTSAEERTAIRYIDGVCSTCHNSDIIKSTQASRQEWLDIVNNMNAKGAGLSEQDVELLVNYLTQKYGLSK